MVVRRWFGAAENGMKANWSVVIIYEDLPTREEAVKFSDGLVRRFWSEFEFDVGWWSMQDLEKSGGARAAAEKAAKADLLVFALKPEGELPDCFFGWVDRWIDKRGEREGALAGLLDPASNPNGIATQKYLYLRTLAHRSGMDYLMQLPENMVRTIPDSIDSYAQRASTKTSVLDDILNRPIPAGSPKGRSTRILR
jgi:hypothetical protein